MAWHQVPDFKFTTEPFIKKVKVDGTEILLVSYEGAIHALSSTCPHAGAELSGGWCKDGKVICPIHRYAYDIKSGRGDAGQNDYVDVYPVDIQGGDIYIEITSFLEKLKKAFK